MVKPESHTRQFDARSHSSERRLIPETEAMLSTLEFSVIKHQPTQKSPTPQEIKDDFLNYYSHFIGSNLSEKTAWKSENFSQSQENIAPDRNTNLDPSKAID